MEGFLEHSESNCGCLWQRGGEEQIVSILFNVFFFPQTYRGILLPKQSISPPRVEEEDTFLSVNCLSSVSCKPGQGQIRL